MVTVQHLPLRLMADSLINTQQSSETNIQRINMHLNLLLQTSLPILFTKQETGDAEF